MYWFIEYISYQPSASSHSRVSPYFYPHQLASSQTYAASLEYSLAALDSGMPKYLENIPLDSLRLADPKGLQVGAGQDDLW